MLLAEAPTSGSDECNVECFCLFVKTSVATVVKAGGKWLDCKDEAWELLVVAHNTPELRAAWAPLLKPDKCKVTCS